MSEGGLRGGEGGGTWLVKVTSGSEKQGESVGRRYLKGGDGGGNKVNDDEQGRRNRFAVVLGLNMFDSTVDYSNEKCFL